MKPILLSLLLLFTYPSYALNCTQSGNRTVCNDSNGEGRTCVESPSGTLVCSDN